MSTRLTATAGGESALSLADLEVFDPTAPAGGDERRFCCPLPACADKPVDSAHRTLSLRVDTGLWLCYRCQGAGKLRDHWEDRPRRSRQQARRAQLRRTFEVRVEQPAAEPSETQLVHLERYRKLARPIAGTPGAANLAARGIPVEVATRAGVLYADNFYGRPAILYPLQDQAGNLVALGGRYIDDAAPKTRIAGRAKEGVFLAPMDALAADPVILVEGPACALTLAACGIPAVALNGVSWPSWLPKHLLGRRAIVALDADQGGDDAAPKLTAALQQFGAQTNRWRPSAKDWNAVAQDLGLDTLREALRSSLRSSPEAPSAPRVEEPDPPHLHEESDPDDAVAPPTNPECPRCRKELVPGRRFLCAASDRDRRLWLIRRALEVAESRQARLLAYGRHLGWLWTPLPSPYVIPSGEAAWRRWVDDPRHADILEEAERFLAARVDAWT